MAALILPSRRVVQPQGPVEIDWANPLASGLLAVLDGNKKTYHTKVGRFGPVSSSLTVPVQHASASGIGYRHPSYFSHTLGTADIGLLGYLGDVTLVSGIIPGTTSSVNDPIFAGSLFGHKISSAVGSTAGLFSASFRGVGTVTADGPVVDLNALAVASARDIKGFEQSLFVNGKKQSAVFNASPTVFTSGAFGPGTMRSAVLFGAVWERALSDAEINAVSENPWQLFRPIQRRIWVPVAGGGGDLTGSLNATETGSDTFASSGTVLVSGALSATESGPDTFSSAGAVVVSGSLAVTESGPDTFAASGLLGTSGSLSVTESGPDTFSATGTTTGGVSGSLDATEEGSDAAAVSGVVVVAGSLAVTESGADTFAASGAVVVTGLLSATESGPDTFSALGVTASVSGSLNATEQGSDTAEIRSSEQAGEGRGFVMVDLPSALWWKRKPKSMPEEVAEQKLQRVAGVIERIARDQVASPEPATVQREQARQIMAPLAAEMPGFDWSALYRDMLNRLIQQRLAEQMAAQEIERIRLFEADEDDVLLLLMAA